MWTYEVTFINRAGETVTKTATARNENEAVQLVGAFNLVIISVINLDL